MKVVPEVEGLKLTHGEKTDRGVAWQKDPEQGEGGMGYRERGVSYRAIK